MKNWGKRGEQRSAHTICLSIRSSGLAKVLSWRRLRWRILEVTAFPSIAVRNLAMIGNAA